MSRDVQRLEYSHVDEARSITRVHDFGKGVEMWALEDGAVLLRSSRGRRLWDEFEVTK